MLAFPPADTFGDVSQIAGPILALIVGSLLTALLHRSRDRRKGATDVVSMVQEHDVTLYGRKPTRSDPDPPPGLDAQMRDVIAVQSTHTALLEDLATKVTPNGGNTRQAGDLLLLIAEKLNIPIPARDDDPHVA